MSLNISTASLRALISLTEKKEKLTKELSSIEGQISAVFGGAAFTASKSAVRKIRGGGDVGNGRPKRLGKKRGKHGKTKGLILEALKAAGSAGISVKELSAKLGLKNSNVHVWFSTTGKTLKEIQKTGKGTYRFHESGATAESPVAAVKASGVSKSKISAKKSKFAGKK